MKRITNSIVKRVGAGDLVDYIGGAIAKRRAPTSQKRFVTSVSKKRALKSGITTLGNIAVTTGSGALLRGAMKFAAKKTAPKIVKNAVKKPTKKKTGLRITDTTKRGYQGKANVLGGPKTWNEGGW